MGSTESFRKALGALLFNGFSRSANLLCCSDDETLACEEAFVGKRSLGEYVVSTSLECESKGKFDVVITRGD